MNLFDKKIEPIISVEHIAVSFKQKNIFSKHDYEALKDVSFKLYKGESLGVVGRNGAGKSTLLRLLAGIYKPDKGIINNFSEKTALLSLQLGFIPLLSGRDNAILSGMLMGARKDEVLKELDEIIAFAELEEFIDHPLNTYSTGMRARLGFSVACHLETDVLLIDEVLAVGDSNFQERSKKVLEEKIHSDKTVVIVLHNTVKMSQLCSRVVWIENGVTQMEGPVDEVLEAYQKFLNTKI